MVWTSVQGPLTLGEQLKKEIHFIEYYAYILSILFYYLGVLFENDFILSNFILSN